MYMNKLNITDVVIYPKQICDTQQDFAVCATVNGKPLSFRFSGQSHDCNDALEVSKISSTRYDTYQTGRLISRVAIGSSTHQYALSIPDDVLFSKPYKNQKDFRFTGQCYFTLPIIPYFKEIMNELYENGQLAPVFLEYLDIDGLDESKKSKRYSIKESEVCDDREVTPEIVTEIVNSSPYLQAKTTDYGIDIYANHGHAAVYLADFYLGKDLDHNFIPSTILSSSAGDGKNIFQVVDIGNGTDGKGYLRACESTKYYDKLDSYDKVVVQLLDNLYTSTHKELNNWKCAQHGTWKFEVKSLDDVAWYVEQIEEAIQTVEEKKEDF